MSNSGNLEVTYCHPHPEIRKGLLSRHFISANLASLPCYGGSHTYHRQHQHGIPTRTLNHFCTATTDEWCRNRLHHHRFIVRFPIGLDPPPPQQPFTGVLIKSIWAAYLRPDVLPDVNHITPNDTAYKWWSCHSGHKRLCKPSRPKQWGPDLPFFQAGHGDWLAGAAAHKSGWCRD